MKVYHYTGKIEAIQNYCFHSDVSTLEVILRDPVRPTVAPALLKVEGPLADYINDSQRAEASEFDNLANWYFDGRCQLHYITFMTPSTNIPALALANDDDKTDVLRFGAIRRNGPDLPLLTMPLCDIARWDEFLASRHYT